MTEEQAKAAAQALGDLLVALEVVDAVPLTGPELLMHSNLLAHDAKAGLVRLCTRGGEDL